MKYKLVPQIYVILVLKMRYKLKYLEIKIYLFRKRKVSEMMCIKIRRF